MSGFFLSNRLIALDLSERFKYVQSDQDFPIDWPGLSTSVVRSDEKYLWSPAFCAARKVGLLIHGRIRLSSAEWAKAETLPLQGGLAAKFLLDAWLSGGEQALVSRHNGAGAIVLWEIDSQELHIWTDKLGVVPIYHPHESVSPWAISSHPDVLADWLTIEGSPPKLDFTSMAESLSIGAVTPPFSFYQEIRLLEPARHYRWAIKDAKVVSKQTEIYWRPASIDPQLHGNSAADAMANAFRKACSRKPPGKAVLLLSGGADSRGLLFAHETPSEIQCLTFCDSENSEVARAKEIASLAKAPHQILFRDPEHYIRGAEHTVRITGGMGSIKDAHFAGFQESLGAINASSLITGCYADYLYKGLAFNRISYRLFGRELPLEKLGPYHPDFYQPHRKISPAFITAITSRRQERLGHNAQDCYEQSPETIADLRVRPLNREADSVGRLYLHATQPWDPIMVDNDLLEFYGRLTPEMKINSRVFGLAVRKLLPKNGKNIPNNNPGQFVLGRPLWQQWIAGSAWLLKNAVQNKFSHQKASLSTSCSWPNFRYLIANSQKIPEIWNNWPSGQKDILAQILGENPAQKNLSEWSYDADLFLRMLTLKLWLQQRKF